MRKIFLLPLLLVFLVLLLSIFFYQPEAKKQPQKLIGEVINVWLDSNVPNWRNLENELLFSAVTGALAEFKQPGLAGGKNEEEIARNVLTKGIGACGDLSVTLGVIADSLGYKSRLVNLYNFPKPGFGHTVFEVFYERKWHLYDPTYGVAYKKDGRVVSFDALRKDPDIAGNGKVKLCQCEGIFGTLSIDYTSPEAYREAYPAGPIGPDFPMWFPVLIDAKGKSEGEIWSLGVENDSINDIKVLSLEFPVPASLWMLGAAYQNVNHVYTFRNLLPGYKYKIEWVIASGRVQFEAKINADNMIIIESHLTTKNHEKQGKKWHVIFIPQDRSGVLRLSHGYRTKGDSVLFDKIAVNLIKE